jgi:hypothetical protein
LRAFAEVQQVFRKRETIWEIAGELGREHSDFKTCLEELLAAVAAGEFPSNALSLLPSPAWGPCLKSRPRGIIISPQEARKIILEKGDACYRLLIEPEALREWWEKRDETRHAGKTCHRTTNPEDRANRTRQDNALLKELLAKWPNKAKRPPDR